MLASHLAISEAFLRALLGAVIEEVIIADGSIASSRIGATGAFCICDSYAFLTSLPCPVVLLIAEFINRGSLNVGVCLSRARGNGRRCVRQHSSPFTVRAYSKSVGVKTLHALLILVHEIAVFTGLADAGR